MSRFGKIRTSGFTRLSIATILFLLTSQARALELNEGFDNVGSLTSNGWAFKNMSNPVGNLGWYQGIPVSEVPISFDAQAGPANSYLATDRSNTTDGGSISNWAFSPTLSYQNGDTFSFWTRTITLSNYSDRMEVRMSTNGSSIDVGTTDLSVGDYSNLLLSINPDLAQTGYPDVWTQYTITISGLAGPTEGRIAFRYFVPDSGPNGNLGNYIGIDTLRITSVPEPSTYALALMSVGVLAMASKRLKARAKG